MSAEDVAAESMTALAEVSQNDFQECFQSFMKVDKSVSV
jgi:hypothetical protein